MPPVSEKRKKRTGSSCPALLFYTRACRLRTAHQHHHTDRYELRSSPPRQGPPGHWNAAEPPPPEPRRYQLSRGHPFDRQQPYRRQFFVPAGGCNQQGSPAHHFLALITYPAWTNSKTTSPGGSIGSSMSAVPSGLYESVDPWESNSTYLIRIFDRLRRRCAGICTDAPVEEPVLLLATGARGGTGIDPDS